MVKFIYYNILDNYFTMVLDVKKVISALCTLIIVSTTKKWTSKN